MQTPLHCGVFMPSLIILLMKQRKFFGGGAQNKTEKLAVKQETTLPSGRLKGSEELHL
jgi:hypothetical protein